MIRIALLFLVAFAAIEAKELIVAIEEVENNVAGDDAPKSSIMIIYKSEDNSVGGNGILKALLSKRKEGNGRLLGENEENPNYASLWQDFKKKHNKFYESNKDQARFRIFINNYQKIQKHNTEFEAGRKSYKMAMNKFGDLTDDEFRTQTKCFDLSLAKSNSSQRGSKFLTPHHIAVPNDIDWRQQGYVTPVKNQGSCGSCWAFSTTGSLEGQHFRQSGQLVSLSEQNLIDCSSRYGNQGCNGGLMDNAFKYIQANGGIDTEDSYPYEGSESTCRFSSQNVGAHVTGYTDIPSGNEGALQNAIGSVGPISVAIDVQSSFQFYGGGVYYEPGCSTTQLNHAVLAVGYGADGGDSYYIVKNSWGQGWGENGYIRMARDRGNNCGIATMASYPLV